jgi:transposase
MASNRGKAYSQDLRERVFQAFDAGMRVGQIAAALMVSVPYVSKALSRRRLTGEVTARAQRCHVPPKLAGLYDRIRERIAAVPDATLSELKAWIAGEHQMASSVSLLSKTLIRLNLTVKKRPSKLPSKIVPMSPKHARSGGRSNPRSIPRS